MPKLACDTCGSTRRDSFEAEKQLNDGSLKVRCKSCLLMPKKLGGLDLFVGAVRELQADGWGVSEAWLRKHAPEYF